MYHNKSEETYLNFTEGALRPPHEVLTEVIRAEWTRSAQHRRIQVQERCLCGWSCHILLEIVLKAYPGDDERTNCSVQQSDRMLSVSEGDRGVTLTRCSHVIIVTYSTMWRDALSRALLLALATPHAFQVWDAICRIDSLCINALTRTNKFEAIRRIFFGISRMFLCNVGHLVIEHRPLASCFCSTQQKKLLFGSSCHSLIDCLESELFEIWQR